VNRTQSACRVACVSLACVLTTTLLACRHAPPALHTKPASASLRRLQHDVDAILSAPALERGYWGVLVRSLATGDTLYALNARKLMMPASTMKIVTLAAAAERLGWDYSYETDVAACGAIDRGTLDGDLLVIGSGDPTVTNDNAAALFDDWAERLKALGVKRISGRLVGDDNRFDHETLGMGWSWDDLQDGYAAGVSALQFNENAARLTIAPGPAIGAPAVVILEPATSGLVVHSLLTTSDAATAASIRTRRLPGSEIVELDGSMPVGAVARVETVSVDSPTRFFVQALRARLLERAITVDGSAVPAADLPSVPPAESCSVVISHQSAPLSAIAIRMMKSSQNLYAETLLKTLGGLDEPTSRSSSARTDKGRKIVENILAAWGVAEDSVIERDGSGLSRYNYMTPDALVSVLTHVDRDERLRDAFDATLPIAGRDGTLATRMKGTAAEGRVRAKTGSMSNVRALAGYVSTADGEPAAFAILANNFDASSDVINKATDAIVVAIANFHR
jgi:serine-type D-Ala-D-Ala carboxypeptidase/endopeptidase (penicillin-binding protein 4)